MSDIIKRLVPGICMLALLAVAWASYPALKTYFSAVLAFTAAERGEPSSELAALIEEGNKDLGQKIESGRKELRDMITASTVIGQAERAHIFNTYVAGVEALRLETQKLRGEVAALGEQIKAPPKPPAAPAPKKPASKAPQGPQQPSGLFSFFPTSWEPTIIWEATVVDHRPRRH